MHITAKGWPIGEPGDPVILEIPTERTTSLLSGEPLALVSHWTGGDYAQDRGHLDSIGLARWIEKLPPAGEQGASWNALVDKDGALIVSACFLSGTWHVGKSGVIRGEQHLNVNKHTVGVEYENAGELRLLGSRFYAWPFVDVHGEPASKYEVAASRAVAVKTAFGTAYFDAFTAAQEATTEALWRALRDRFGWPREAFGYGHVDFDSPRKQDPGPLFPLLRERVLDRIYT